MNRFPLALGTLISALGLALPAAAQGTPYGSGINPPGSLVVTAGVPQVGQSFNVGVANTAVASAPPALAFLAVAAAADPAFPDGTVLPGFGLSTPGALGELLIRWGAPDPILLLGAVPWAGGSAAPAPFTISVPSNPALSGMTFYLQGVLLDATTGPSLGLTNGLSVTLAPPGTTGPVPCVSQIPGMEIIQPGTFLMGSDAASGPPYFAQASEQPVHPVIISYCFWMGATEVTQRQYRRLMGTNPSYFIGLNRPVEGVTWFDAQAYCAAITAQQAALGNLPVGYEYRLPTEAEWEYACRAGTTTEYAVGAELFCDQARISYSFHSNSSCNTNSTVPVGRYAPNAWGLFDMSGNVWEWCLDYWSLYPAGSVTDPFTTGGTWRIVRGGSWAFSNINARSAYRNGFEPISFGNSLGFRVVLAPVLIP